MQAPRGELDRRPQDFSHPTDRPKVVLARARAFLCFGMQDLRETLGLGGFSFENTRR